MAEGRIQYCRHHTPQLLWQERWVAHSNRAAALLGVIVCVADPQEAARRYARFTGLPADATAGGWRIATTRGWLAFADPGALERALGVEPPSLPWIAGCALESSDMAETRDCLRRSGERVDAIGEQRLLVKLPPELGGCIVFVQGDSDPLGF
jgi:hypothetical protein